MAREERRSFVGRGMLQLSCKRVYRILGSSDKQRYWTVVEVEV